MSVVEANVLKELESMFGRSDLRKIARGDKVVNDVRNGGLMGGCQILVNPTVKYGVT